MTALCSHRPLERTFIFGRAMYRLVSNSLKALLITGTLLLGGGLSAVHAADAETSNALKAVDFSSLPGNKAQIVL
ncbi:MAG: hypothetical protein OEU51_10450, partial [Gammaproteobacteria bacterium]|nr:hypothetical protein [Gammaproteobacteria bacterium]